MHLAFGGEKAVHIIWKNTTQTVKFRGGNIMFWGCFLAYDTGKRHIIEKRMDLQMYQNILDTNLMPSTRMMKIKTKMDISAG